MMIGLNTRLTDEQSATSDEPFFTVNPNVEILVRLITGKCNVHALNDPPSLGC